MSILLKLSLIDMHLLLDTVLLQDLHLSKLMLINQCLRQHFIRNQRQCTILPAMEHLSMLPVLRWLLPINVAAILACILPTQGDRGRVLSVLALVEADLKRAVPVR